MTLWFVFGAMSIVAVAFAVWPLYRRQGKLTPLSAGLIVGIVALSSGLYYHEGSPGTPSGGGEGHNIEQMIDVLVTHLKEKPDDVDGWKMLGRSYMTTGNGAGAVEAFEKAVELESAQDASTLVSLGEALLSSGQEHSVTGRVASLFENALAIDPNNPQALFYGGIGAVNRGDKATAADRWERLLALNPPEEIEGILRQRVAEWRGEPQAAVEAPAAEGPAITQAPAEQPGAIVSIAISLSDAAKAALPEDATVFVIARDPSQPGPPIAVARRRLAELPETVQLGDGDSMVPGRVLSGFDQFEVVARVSLSGQPVAQSGDWYGSLEVKPAENNSVTLSVSERVP
jgi:cytochrome c-type biogenesis protein CcmH